MAPETRTERFAIPMPVPGLPVRPDMPQIVWYSSRAAAPPAVLEATVGVMTVVRSPLAAPEICLLDVANTGNGGTAGTIRRTVGSEAYLVGIVDDEGSRGMLSALIDSGLDDAVFIGDEDGLRAALARGRRVLADRKVSYAHRQRQDLEREYLQACIDNLPTPIFFKNGRGVYVGCNTAFEAFIGRPSEEIIGRTVWEIAPPELAAAYEEADRALIERGGVQVYEGQVCRDAELRRDVSFHKAVIVDGQGGVRGIAGAMLDITDRKMLERDLKRAAERDPLTDLYNRRKFFDYASALTPATPEAFAPTSIAVMDIDHFKAINDGCGHAVGDEVLRRVAAEMKAAFEDIGIVARAGGEEFYALLPGLSPAAASAHLESLRQNIAEINIDADGTPIGVTISIGVAGFDPQREAPSEGLKRADLALYRAKNAGRNQLMRAA
ncbi:GGDEF domain-containing protein [Ciceribacter sp. L1K22]|uniref:GGDEF domain-containing protein n=1 Tax=Ciceribacter sp. L1K22 TaxID=2820275 RepID=UPI001ABE58B3|nr:GGDEF domain-containing protein [Ciceribacter sp. L1K22]MBO3759650.1 diguanylate cyclase [Ciceribacter sp. L1K22]